jgi:formylglycine-generating enzyme required for sulfatase activity
MTLHPRLYHSVGLLVLISLSGCQSIDSDTTTLTQRPSLPPVLDGFSVESWYLPDDDLFGFVKIPSGSFRMGADQTLDSQAFENERWSPSASQGIVDVEEFYISRSEVTIAQFASFVDNTGAQVSTAALTGNPDHPVASVSWPDALAYCRWLQTVLSTSQNTPAELQKLFQDGWRVTLPNEAQWEKAARGTDGRTYPWGNTPRPEAANYNASTTRPVGHGMCNSCPYNLSDMAGNVWELTRSRYRPYPFTESPNLDLSTDALFVMRGGSYADGANLVRTTTRGGADPGVRRPFIGFRVAITR